MDVSNTPTLALVDKWRTPDVIPHLPRQHGEDKEDGQHTPGGLIEQKLKVVPPQVDQATHQSKQDQEGHGACVVGWSEHTYIHLCPLIDPSGNGFPREANSLYIHVVLLFWLALWWEVDECWSTIQIHTLESLTTFIKVDHGKEHFARIELAVSVAVCNKAELVTSLPADGTATMVLQGCKHDHHRVVLRLGPDQVLEGLTGQLDNRPPLCEVQELLYPVIEGQARGNIGLILSHSSSIPAFPTLHTAGAE